MQTLIHHLGGPTHPRSQSPQLHLETLASCSWHCSNIGLLYVPQHAKVFSSLRTFTNATSSSKDLPAHQTPSASAPWRCLYWLLQLRESHVLLSRGLGYAHSFRVLNPISNTKEAPGGQRTFILLCIPSDWHIAATQ